jgi:hypothetical protein
MRGSRVYPLPERTACYVCVRLRLLSVRKPEPIELPHCHTVQEIAKAMKLSEETIRNIFQDRPGVIKITKGKRLRGKREYVTLRVPNTVLAAWLRETTG